MISRPYFLLLTIIITSFLSATTAYAADAAITARAEEIRYRLDYQAGVFSGPAYVRLIAEARDAQFFLIGEEHGIAENPKLTAALFADIVDDGYTKLAIEVSPFIAAKMDEALRTGGMDGLEELFGQPGGMPAFFGMGEEAEMLVSARQSAGSDGAVLWGLDYEVLSERQMLAALAGMEKPADAESALAALSAAVTDAWQTYEDTSNPQYVFSFSGDPELVRAVERTWPDRNSDAAWILDTIEETLEINRLFVARQGWQSNARRAAFLRANFVRHWLSQKSETGPTKVMLKFGASHMIRGLNYTNTYDLGSLLPPLAELEGASTFSMLVLPGADSLVAVLDPTSFTYRAAPAKDGYAKGLDPLLATAFDDAFTLIDLRPLRPLVNATTTPELKKVIFGFDALLVMSGSTPASNFSD